MADKTDEERLFESWRQYFENAGFSEEDVERAAEIAAGPAVMARVREAQGGDIDLTGAFRDHFASQGATPEVAEAMGMVASGELNPSPGLSGGLIEGLGESGSQPPAEGDEKELLESWKERYLGQGASPEQAERMAEISVRGR